MPAAGTARRVATAALARPSRITPAALSARRRLAAPKSMILVDLENVGSKAVQSSLDSLHHICKQSSVTLRTYTATQNNLSPLATNKVASVAKNAVDVQIAFDIGRTSMTSRPGSRFLVVTKDSFGRALADVPSAATDHVTLDSKLPYHWRRLLGVPSLGQVVGDAMRAQRDQPVRRLSEKVLPASRHPEEAGVSPCGKTCHVCGVTVTKKEEMREHVNGRKHAKNLQRQRAAGRYLREAAS